MWKNYRIYINQTYNLHKYNKCTSTKINIYYLVLQRDGLLKAVHKEDGMIL